MRVVKRVKSSKNNLKDLVSAFEELVFRNVKEQYPHNWGDTCIQSLFQNISLLLRRKRIRFPGGVIRTHGALYALTDEPEKKLSDIALLCKINFHDGKSVEGATFLKVQLKDPDKNTFQGLRKDELRRMGSLAPHAQLLLCDYDCIAGMAFTSIPESIVGNVPTSWEQWVPFTYAAAAPAELCYALGDKNTGLYKVSIPLSYQFCFRYLFGIDLEYRSIPLDVAKGYRTDKGRAKYLMFLSVAHGGSELQTDIDFDRNSYSELEA